MITPICPDIAPRGRYSGAETARLLGISRETLRLWVMQGRITPRPAKIGKRRSYVGSDIMQLWKLSV